MILRTRQTASACLRCQMRLSGLFGGAGSRLRPRAPLSQPSLQALRARRAYSTAPNDAVETQPIPDSAENVEKDRPLVRRTMGEETAEEGVGAQRSSYRPEAQWKAEGAFSIKRDTYQTQEEWARNKHLNRANLKEGFAPVKVDSLGRPTNIVVLRENTRSKAPRYVEHKGPEVVIETETVDIFAEMQKDIGVAGAAEVIENIGSLRPKGTTKRTWEQITELEKHLVKGFTNSQLLAYIQDFEVKRLAENKTEEEKQEEVEEDEQPTHLVSWLSVKESKLATYEEGLRTEEVSLPTQEEESTSHVLSRTPWMPGKSAHGDYFENSVLRGYTSDAATQKSKVAMFIIRSCWGVSATEYESAVGEVELKLSPEDFELLIAPRLREPPLKKISDALISTENEKIEAYRARDALRITGTPAQTARIAAAIDVVLSNIRTHKISLAELKRKDGFEFNLAVYAELEKLTNSEVIRLSKDMVTIKGMNLRPWSGLSTVPDVARRVLLASSDAADQTAKNVGFKMTDKPAYAVEWPLREGMSWRQKMRHWARWESPIEKPLEEPVAQKEYVMELDELTGQAPKATESVKEASRPDSELVTTQEREAAAVPDLGRNALWHSPRRESYAVIGNLLHEAVPGIIVDPKPVSFDAQDISDRRTLFVSQDRNLSRLVDHLPAPTHSRRVFMKFLPSPWTARGGDAITAFPAIEMAFVRREDQGLNLQYVHAISEDIQNHVMIPDRTLDISFRQTTEFLISTKKAKVLPQIATFLEKSQLKPNVGEIVTPAELTLPIPSYICRNLGKMFEGAEGKMLDVQYLFAGLEFREYTIFDYHNWRLRYSNINGGRAAGQHSELALEFKHVKAVESSAEPSDEVLREFTAAAFQLVDDLDTPRPVRVRGLEDQTTGTEEGKGIVRYEYLPSVRRCLVKKEGEMMQQFTCFVHRPQFFRELGEGEDGKEAEEVDEGGEGEVVKEMEGEKVE